MTYSGQNVDPPSLRRVLTLFGKIYFMIIRRHYAVSLDKENCKYGSMLTLETFTELKEVLFDFIYAFKGLCTAGDEIKKMSPQVTKADIVLPKNGTNVGGRL